MSDPQNDRQVDAVANSSANISGRTSGKLGIIISMFPELHETFILRELAALERKGVDFQVYSLQLPRDPITLDDAIRLSEQRTQYSSLINLTTLKSLLTTLFKHPLRLSKTIAKLVVNGRDRPMDIVKALAILPITLHFGDHAKSIGVTHLHGHWANIPTTACWFLQQIHGFTWSAAIHGEDIFSANRFLPYKLDRAKFSVVCSGYFCNHLKEGIGVDLPEQIHLNYHGLDPRVMELSSTIKYEPRGTDTDQPVQLVSIGRMVPTKGHDTLLRACALLGSEHKLPYHLNLIGSGPDEEKLQALSKELGLDDHVTFCGGIAFDEVLDKLVAADAFCLAPRLIPGHPPDGIPNVIAEAMALRVPVVTTRVSAIPELVEDRVSGRLVEVDDHVAFAAAIAELMQGENMTQQLSEGGFAKVEALFNQNKNIDELIALFEQYTGSSISPQSADL